MMKKEGKACQHLGCKMFRNLANQPGRYPPGKERRKLALFWAAASRNSANVGGRSCASLSQIGGHRTLCVHARCVVKVSRWKSGRMSSSGPDGPTGRIMGRPSGLLPSSPPGALACVHLSRLLYESRPNFYLFQSSVAASYPGLHQPPL